MNKPSFRRRKIVEELAWFDRYLFQTFKSPVVRTEESSPLAHALAARDYARHGVAYGETHGGTLIPETVSIGTLRVGRFEVTRAQWHGLFPDTPLESGRENLPMTGVSGEQAQEYVKRLAARTGRAYRLPTPDELKKLPKGSEENTLDWWIGYKPSPNDARSFRALANDVPGTLGLPPLVRPVGTRRPGFRRVGDEVVRIHDAGGNVGEWTSDATGTLAVLGGYAYGSSDDRDTTRVLPAYAGLRVVLED